MSMFIDYNYSTGKYDLKCIACGRAFNAKRRDAKTCGDNCRKRYSQRHAELETALRNAGSAIYEIARLGNKYPDMTNDVIAAIKLLQGRLEGLPESYAKNAEKRSQ